MFELSRSFEGCASFEGESVGEHDIAGVLGGDSVKIDEVSDALSGDAADEQSNRFSGNMNEEKSCWRPLSMATGSEESTDNDGSVNGSILSG